MTGKAWLSLTQGRLFKVPDGQRRGSSEQGEQEFLSSQNPFSAVFISEKRQGKNFYDSVQQTAWHSVFLFIWEYTVLGSPKGPCKSAKLCRFLARPMVDLSSLKFSGIVHLPGISISKNGCLRLLKKILFQKQPFFEK